MYKEFISTQQDRHKNKCLCILTACILQLQVPVLTCTIVGCHDHILKYLCTQTSPCT